MTLLSTAEPTRVTPPPPIDRDGNPVPWLPPFDPYDHQAHFPGLDSITWTGWDGVEWELWCQRPHWGRTGIALGRGIRGLDFPDLDTFVSESPALDGGQYQGYRVRAREVFLNLRVFASTTSQEWVDYDRRFARAFLPAQPGVRGPGALKVVAPDGTARTLECHPIHDGGHSFEVDPSVRGWAQYGRTLIAYRPLWRGPDTVFKAFAAAGATGFFGGEIGKAGAPFVIGTGASLGAATIDNPGDEPTWPIWRLIGPFTQVKIGTPQRMTTINVAVPAGEWLVVDTDPLAQAITDQNGRAVFPTAVGGAPFTPVAPGENVPLVAEVVGDGTIEVTLQPLYHRAW